jgi:signal transduction histidine kinase/CheY-like chemotaxis protein
MTEPDASQDVRTEAARRRRRIGTTLLMLAVAAVAAQSFVEWLLPYDVMAWSRLAQAIGQPALSPRVVSLVWGVATLLALWPLRAGKAGATWAVVAGIAVGSSRLAAGGSVPAMVLLLAAGMGSLGWQAGRHGGLALLLSTALSIVGWDLALTRFAGLWPVCLALVAVFMWIERRHIQATDQRLFATLAERDALIRDLDAKQQQLLALQKERTHLLAGIGHDLRQPLWAVRLYADAMLARQPDSPDSEALRQQLRATDDAIGMLDQFSDFAAIERGALNSQLQRVNLRQVVDVVVAWERESRRGEPLDIHVYGREAWVRTDPMQLKRIVQNLVGNAVRHSLRAQQPRHSLVLVGVRPHHGGYAIDVVDNGDGIARDKLEEVFQPYVQLDRQAGAAKGSRGLGLAIVRGLVVQLGMHLAPVQSRPGRGTRFRVVLPPALRWRDLPGESLTDTLLAVLDDDDAARSALVAALQSTGAECVDAGSLKTLKRRLSEQVRFPDALVFDLDLGTAGNGVEAVVSLRQEWELEVPALIVTGRPAQAPALPGACRLLPKPAALPELVATLDELLTANRG